MNTEPKIIEINGVAYSAEVPIISFCQQCDLADNPEVCEMMQCADTFTEEEIPEPDTDKPAQFVVYKKVKV